MFFYDLNHSDLHAKKHSLRIYSTGTLPAAWFQSLQGKSREVLRRHCRPGPTNKIWVVVARVQFFIFGNLFDKDSILLFSVAL